MTAADWGILAGALALLALAVGAAWRLLRPRRDAGPDGDELFALVLPAAAAMEREMLAAQRARQRPPTAPAVATDPDEAALRAWFDEVRVLDLSKFPGGPALAPFESSLAALSVVLGEPADVTRFPGVGSAAALWSLAGRRAVLRQREGRVELTLARGEAREAWTVTSSSGIAARAEAWLAEGVGP